MRKTPLFILAAMFALPWRLWAQGENLTASNLSEFLARYQESLTRADQAYEELMSENLPLLDEAGQPLSRRHIDDRRQTLANLGQTARQFAANPEDLVLTTTLLIQTEVLADDLYDLSQIAYDNDREELAKNLSDLETTMAHNKDLLETYTLSLAAAKQERIQELEKENRDLQQKLKETAARAKDKASR